MVPTTAQLLLIAGGRVTNTTTSNANSVRMSLENWASRNSLTPPHRLAHYLGQLLEEGGGFKYDREIWGPTPAQKRYEGRKDLGNTEPGDGAKFKGHGPIQVTGRGNTTRFYKWCKDMGMSPPNFVKNPELINTDPWEGLSAIWYWEVGNPTGQSLNRYADENNIMQITKKVNGGLTHLDARINYYVRAALVFLGYQPTEVKEFQSQHDLKVDGDAGPLTLSALHMALSKLSGVIDVKPAPVTEKQVVKEKEVIIEDKEVPVIAKGSDKRSWVWPAGGTAILTQVVTGFTELPWEAKIAVAGVGIAAVVAFLWMGELIVRRVRKLVSEFGA